MSVKRTDALVVDLIERYIATASNCVARLREELGAQDLLLAVNSREVPREGVLHDGARYRFHGVGCLIERDRLTIDLDFGPGGRCDGFDAWRLHAFALQFPELAQLHDLGAIVAGLAALEARGQIVAPQNAPSPHLLYLAGEE